MEKDCVFCKVVEGKIPAAKIYEDDEALAFLDIQPVNLGHTLFVPKEHYPTFLETPSGVISSLVPKLQKVARAVKKGTAADGINISVNNDKAAGQLVFHTHFHIIPRFVDDGLKHWGHREYNEDQINLVAEKIKKALTK